MFESRSLVAGRARAVRCRGDLRRFGPEEEVTDAAVILVRRGAFVRRADGRAALADVTTGYLQRPGECQQIAHPAGGDVCTTLTVPDDLADRLALYGRVTVTPEADLTHRRLLASPSPDLLTELLAFLVPAPQSNPSIDFVRAELHRNPSADLPTLAAAAGWSPWYLSRTFHAATGLTLTTYRRRLRLRAALDDLAADPPPALADLAFRHGFADQPHLTRALQAETGHRPTTLRRLLSPDP